MADDLRNGVADVPDHDRHVCIDALPDLVYEQVSRRVLVSLFLLLLISWPLLLLVVISWLLLLLHLVLLLFFWHDIGPLSEVVGVVREKVVLLAVDKTFQNVPCFLALLD